MKKILLLYFVLISFFPQSYAQKIQYSRQTIASPFADVMQLVADVGGYHHLVCFTANKPTRVYIFDAQLQLKEQKQVDLRASENCDIRLIAFKNFYLLYIHTMGSERHELYKISGDGKLTPLSQSFQNLLTKEIGKVTSTVQIVNKNEEIFLLTHTFYDEIQKMGSSVIELDQELNPVMIRKVLYAFSNDETLQQAMLEGNDLLVLKTLKNNETGNSLDMVKVDLLTGHSIMYSYNSGAHMYFNPAFRYNNKDSTILVYSIIREPAISGGQRTVFLSLLNDSLQQIQPLKLLKGQFKNNITENFLLLNGPSSCWINLSNRLRIVRVRSSNAGSFNMDEIPGLGIGRLNNMEMQTRSDYTQPTGVRFTILDENFKMVRDSTVPNSRKVSDLEPRPFSQFTMNNKAYLLMIQNFTSSRRGLLLVSRNENNQLATEDIPVFDRFEYLLSLFRTVNNRYVILPYTHKNDIGLVKIKIAD
jgi:hypothetical protein